MKTKLLTVLSLTAISVASFAQISLVKDLNPGTNNSTFDYSFTFKNKLYSEAVFDRKRRAIASDGTEVGTKVITYEAPPLFGTTPITTELEEYTNFYLTTNDSLYIATGKSLLITDGNVNKVVNPDKDLYNNFKSMTDLALFKGDIYFSADYRVTTPTFQNFGQSLFKYNGKSITKVKDVLSGSSFFNRSKISNSNYLFFVGFTPETGNELWRSDGTEAGTVLVKDIREGNKGGINSALEHAIVFNDILYFAAESDTSIGEELWRSDGTETGTYMVKNISETNFPDSEPAQFVIYNNQLYFFAKSRGEKSGEHQKYDLWKTDGTEDGTIKIKEIGARIGDGGFQDGKVILFKEEIFFKGGGKLWKSDGTEDGTMVIADANTVFNAEDALAIYNNELFFVNGSSLWKTDGNENNLTNITNDDFSRIRGVFSTSTHVFFMGTKEETGAELYSYADATASTKDQALNEVGLNFYNKQLHISNLTSSKSTLSIYNMLGKRVSQKTFSSNGNTFVDLNLKQGIYMVNIKTHLGTSIAKKILISQ